MTPENLLARFSIGDRMNASFLRRGMVLIFTSMMLMPALAQEVKSKKTQKQYSCYSVGVGGRQENISFLSPLYYPGNTLSINYLTMKQRKSMSISGNNIFSVNMADGVNEKQITSYAFDIQRAYTFPINALSGEGSPFSMSVGPAYWMSGDVAMKMDNENNLLYYDFNNMASAALHLSHRFKQVYLFNETLIPFLGLYSASDYGYMFPTELVEDDGNVFNMFDAGSFGMNRQIVNRLNCDIKYLKRKGWRTLRLQYELNAQKLEVNNNTKHFVSHVFRIGFPINKTTTHYVHN